MQQTIGASLFTAASPVMSPTHSGPNLAQRSKNFSLTRALIGLVYTVRLSAAMAKKCTPSATSDFPDPVGVLRITFLPEAISRSASSCAG